MTIPGMEWIELPWLLSLAVVLPIVFALLLRRARASRGQRLQRFGALDVVRRLIPPSALAGSGWRAVRLGLAAALAGLAIAGPRWGQERTVVRSSGVPRRISQTENVVTPQNRKTARKTKKYKLADSSAAASN